MSKKKRQLREKTVAHDVSETPETPDKHNAGRMTGGSCQSNDEPANAGLRMHLKSNWWTVSLVAFLSLGILGAGLKYLEEDAQRQTLNGNRQTVDGQNQSLLNRLNPFLPAALPNPTPQLSKELIYAGDKLLTIEDANATAVPPADLAVWRPSTGGWYVMAASGQMRAAEGWGLNGDKPLPGDYDGDGKTDFCVFRPSENKWYILQSSNGVIASGPFGISGDTPKPADYDGDGKTDIAVFRKDMPSAGLGTWLILKSSDAGLLVIQFGVNADKDTLAPADYDGDRRADVTVWRNADMNFYTLRSSDGAFQTASLGQSSIETVSGDYDGDGRADYAIRKQSDGYWYIRYSSTGVIQPAVQWGFATDTAVQNDYDGDGRVDIAVWRAGAWYISNSSSGQTRIENWGQMGDFPVPLYYRR